MGIDFLKHASVFGLCPCAVSANNRFAVFVGHLAHCFLQKICFSSAVNCLSFCLGRCQEALILEIYGLSFLCVTLSRAVCRFLFVTTPSVFSQSNIVVSV